MRIAFYGSSLLSSYWNGAATYYRGLLRDLAPRGHSVTFYEPDAFDRQKHRDIEPPPWAAVRCAKLALDRGVGGALVGPSSWFMKSPPQQFTDEEARERTLRFVAGED